MFVRVIVTQSSDIFQAQCSYLHVTRTACERIHDLFTSAGIQLTYHKISLHIILLMFISLLACRPVRTQRSSTSNLFKPIQYMNTEFGRYSFSYCFSETWSEIPATTKASAAVAVRV